MHAKDNTEKYVTFSVKLKSQRNKNKRKARSESKIILVNKIIEINMFCSIVTITAIRYISSHSLHMVH